MPELIDAYRILQVGSSAGHEEIKAAYRRLARRYHPDLASGPEPAARMAEINAAWELIGKPAARADYDRSRGTPLGAAAATPQGGRPQAAPPPDTVSRDWTSGRSTQGSGFDPSMRTAEGLGAAGSPPGRPSGTVLTFGRFSGWSLGEIARQDPDYLEWLDRMPIGRAYREEIDTILRAAGRRRSAETEAVERRGLFRRR